MRVAAGVSYGTSALPRYSLIEVPARFVLRGYAVGIQSMGATTALQIRSALYALDWSGGEAAYPTLRLLGDSVSSVDYIAAAPAVAKVRVSNPHGCVVEPGLYAQGIWVRTTAGAGTPTMMAANAVTSTVGSLSRVGEIATATPWSLALDWDGNTAAADRLIVAGLLSDRGYFLLES